jgi:hypothetical protein
MGCVVMANHGTEGSTRRISAKWVVILPAPTSCETDFDGERLHH